MIDCSQSQMIGRAFAIMELTDYVEYTKLVNTISKIEGTNYNRVDDIDDLSTCLYENQTFVRCLIGAITSSKGCHTFLEMKNDTLEGKWNLFLLKRGLGKLIHVS